MERQLPTPPVVPSSPQPHDRFGPVVPNLHQGTVQQAANAGPHPHRQHQGLQGYVQQHGYQPPESVVPQQLQQAPQQQGAQYQRQQQVSVQQHQQYQEHQQGQPYVPVTSSSSMRPPHLQPVTMDRVTSSTSSRASSLPEHLRPRPPSQQGAPSQATQRSVPPEQLQQESQEQQRIKSMTSYPHTGMVPPAPGPSAQTAPLPPGPSGTPSVQGAPQHAATGAPAYAAHVPYTSDSGARTAAAPGTSGSSMASGAAPAASQVAPPHASAQPVGTAAANQPPSAWYGMMQSQPMQLQQQQQVHVGQLTAPPQQQQASHQQHLQQQQQSMTGYEPGQVHSHPPNQLQPQSQPQQPKLLPQQLSQPQQQLHQQQLAQQHQHMQHRYPPQQQQQQVQQPQEQQQLQQQRQVSLSQVKVEPATSQQGPSLQPLATVHPLPESSSRAMAAERPETSRYPPPPSVLPQLKPAMATAPAPAAGFVQLVEQPGGIQLDSRGGLRFVGLGEAGLGVMGEAPSSQGGPPVPTGPAPSMGAPLRHQHEAAFAPQPSEQQMYGMPKPGPSEQQMYGMPQHGPSEQQMYGMPKPGPSEQQMYGMPKPGPSEQQMYGMRKPGPSEQQMYGMPKPGPSEQQMYGKSQPAAAPAWGVDIAPPGSGRFESSARYAPVAEERQYHPAQLAQYSQEPAPGNYGGVGAAPMRAACADEGRNRAGAAAGSSGGGGSGGGAAPMVIDKPSGEGPKAAAARPPEQRATADAPAAGGGRASPKQAKPATKPAATAASGAAGTKAPEKPPLPLAEAVRLCEALERTVANTKEDPELMATMLPQLLATCKTRISELARAIKQAKLDDKAKRSVEDAKASAAAAAAATAAAAEPAPQAADQGSGDGEELGRTSHFHMAYLLERSVRTLWPLNTVEHQLLRSCAEVLLLAVGCERTIVAGQDMQLERHQLLGANLCNKPTVLSASAAARSAGLMSTGLILRKHDAFEVVDLVAENKNKQWLVRLRTECLPSYDEIRKALGVAIDVFLGEEKKKPASPSAAQRSKQSGSTAAGSGASASGEAMPEGLLDVPDLEPESREQRKALHHIAMHLVRCKGNEEGLFSDKLQAVREVLPKDMAKPYGGQGGLRSLEQLLKGHPFFWISHQSGGAAGGGSGGGQDVVRLHTDTLLEAQYRVRRLMLQQEQLQQSKKRKGGDGSVVASLESEGEELVGWWLEQRERRAKYRQR